MILGEWKMPEAVCLGVLHHYRPSAGEGTPGAMLHLASWVATQMGKGVTVEANQWEVSDEILELAGLNKGQVEASISETQTAFDELRKRLRPA
jgi:HD-like signal output (HDOD) protein